MYWVLSNRLGKSFGCLLRFSYGETEIHCDPIPTHSAIFLKELFSMSLLHLILICTLFYRAHCELCWRAPASKQCPMLNMGKEVKTVTAIYDHGILVHLYLAPLVRMTYCFGCSCNMSLWFLTCTIFKVVTILASSNANVGTIRSTAIPLLKEVLEPLCSTLLNSLAPGRDYPDDIQHSYYRWKWINYCS